MRLKRFTIKELEQLNYRDFRDGFEYDEHEAEYINTEGYSQMQVQLEDLDLYGYDVKWASFTEPRDRYSVSPKYGSYETKGYIDIIAYFKDGILVKALVRDIEKCKACDSWQHLSGMYFEHYWINNRELPQKISDVGLIEVEDEYKLHRLYKFENGREVRINTQANDLYKITLLDKGEDWISEYDRNVIEVNAWLDLVKNAETEEEE